MEYILVAIGGAIGSISRFWLGRAISERAKSAFPYGTFFINISGAALLGVISGLNLRGNSYLVLGDGFLGAYTTFSTFMYEGFNLFQENEMLNAVTYITASLILGLLGYFSGFHLVKLF